MSQFAAPILIENDQTAIELERVPLTGKVDGAEYDEDWLQDLLFSHPAALPVHEIDMSFDGIVPICRELNTPAGPIDVLYATPSGKLVVLEAKLWRNPEARRKVVGQVLDYAKELGRWSYEDLQREVSRRTGRTGNALFDAVAAPYPGLDEAAFVDEVSRGLRHGDFLLLICGDGIREGVAAITDFLDQYNTLHFTFGLVEMAIYRTPTNGLLVQPRVLAQSMIFKRSVISLTSAEMVVDEDADEEKEIDRELSDLEHFYEGFWTEFLSELQLDDVSQPLPNMTRMGNIFLRMPQKSSAWITIYFFQKENEVGTYLTFTRGTLADLMYERLSEDKEAIESELGVPVEWRSADGKYTIIAKTTFPDLRASDHKQAIKDWLADRANRFVNVFRHRIERIVEEA